MSDAPPLTFPPELPISARVADIALAVHEHPVVIVAGELDRVDPVSVVREHILVRYPLAQVNFLANRGHLLPVEAPDDIAGIVAGFAGAL